MRNRCVSFNKVGAFFKSTRALCMHINHIACSAVLIGKTLWVLLEEIWLQFCASTCISTHFYRCAKKGSEN